MSVEKTMIVRFDTSIRKMYPVTVDYERNVEDAIKIGRYDSVDEGINSVNFTTQRTGRAHLEIRLIHFGFWFDDLIRRFVMPSLCYVMPLESMLEDIDRRGMRPVELRELLAFGAKYPGAQRKFLIMAPSPVAHVLDYPSALVLCLEGDRSERSLSLYEPEINDIFRYAVVCK